MPSSIITDAAPLLAPFAVSLGDPAGIGPEIVAKSWVMREARGLPAFFAGGDAASLRAVWLGPVERIDSPEEAAQVFPRALPCLQVGEAGEVIPGAPGVDGARVLLMQFPLHGDA